MPEPVSRSNTSRAAMIVTRAIAAARTAAEPQDDEQDRDEDHGGRALSHVAPFG